MDRGMKFRNSYGEVFNLDGVIEFLHRKVAAYPEDSHQLIVGSDSQQHGTEIVYITVIVLHRQGRGGNLFYSKHSFSSEKYLPLSTRLLKETEYTVEILKRIENSIVVDLIGRKNLSAHVDAGQNGESRKMLEACIGWIVSLGFDCASKPEAFVASHVADRYTK